MSRLLNTDPIRREVSPGVWVDLTARCAECGDREGMATQQSRRSGLCTTCDPDGDNWCDGCGQPTRTADLTVIDPDLETETDLCPTCTRIPR